MIVVTVNLKTQLVLKTLTHCIKKNIVTKEIKRTFLQTLTVFEFLKAMISLPHCERFSSYMLLYDLLF